MEKILPISLKLNFTPNTLGCYGLTRTALSIVVPRNGRGWSRNLDCLLDEMGNAFALNYPSNDKEDALRYL